MYANAWSVLNDLPDELRVDPDVFVMRLQILVRSKEWEKALILGKSIVQGAPHVAIARFYMACCYCQQGRLDLAD